jgi:hypothetical protein
MNRSRPRTLLLPAFLAATTLWAAPAAADETPPTGTTPTAEKTRPESMTDRAVRREARYRDRLARIRRLHELAEAEGDTARAEELETMGRRLRTRHHERMQRMRKRGGEAWYTAVRERLQAGRDEGLLRAEKARDRARARADDARDRTHERRDEARDGHPGRGDDMREWAHGQRERAHEARDRRHEARDRARDERHDARDRAHDARDDARGKAKDRRDDARDKANDRRDDARDKANDRRDDARGKAKDRRDDARGKAKDRRGRRLRTQAEADSAARERITADNADAELARLREELEKTEG